MHLSKLFFLVTAFTLFLAVVQLFGYPVLELLVIMLIVDFLTLTASIQMANGEGKPSSSNKGLTDKLEAIDKRCSEIFDRVSNSPLEVKLQKHGDDITYLLDSLSRKTTELEDKIVRFGNGMVDSVSGLRNRVDDMEKRKDGESFALGELVYVKDEEDS